MPELVDDLPHTAADGDYDGWFHVSAVLLAPGEQVTPGAGRGAKNFPHGSNSRVHLSRHTGDSDDWAKAIGRDHDPDRMHVYEVEPVGDAEECKGDFGPEFTCRAATVLRLLYTIDASESGWGWRGQGDDDPFDDW